MNNCTEQILVHSSGNTGFVMHTGLLCNIVSFSSPTCKSLPTIWAVTYFR